jgi:hypothetical protein
VSGRVGPATGGYLMVRRFVCFAALAVGIPLLSATAAAAGEGPPQEVFEDSSAWLCEAEAGLPPSHCINAKSAGHTGVIMVFAPDERWPQESYSTNPKADSRPCPHDPDAVDGTWWSPVPGLYVCHHRP